MPIDNTMHNQKIDKACRRSTFAGLPLVASESPAIKKTRLNKARVRELKDKQDAQILQKIKNISTKTKSIFSNEEEMEICQIVRILWKESSIKTTPWILRKIGYIYAERTFNKCVTNWVTSKLAGIGWCKTFVKRNKAYLPRMTLNSPRSEYLYTEAIDETIEKFETIKRKKIGFVDKFAVFRTKKTMKKMLASYNDVTVHSEMAIKTLEKKIKSYQCETPETTIVAMRKLQADCKTHARQLLKIARENIIQVCSHSSRRLFKTELAEDNLVQEESPISKTRSNQLSIHVNNQQSNANHAISDGLNISPQANKGKSQPTPTNFSIESSANYVADNNVSSTEPSVPDALLDVYEEILNEFGRPIESNTVLVELSPNDIEMFTNEYEKGQSHGHSIVSALTSSELNDTVSTIVIDDDSEDDEIVFMGDLPIPKIEGEIIEMECEGNFPMPMKNKFINKKKRRTTQTIAEGSANCVKEETGDIKTFDLVAGSMKFVNVTNGLNNKPDVYFPHADVTITYSNYYLMFHLNKLQSYGQDGSPFDSNYVAHTLKSIFDVSDRVTDILTVDDKIDWKNQKVQFARDLFAVRVNGDQKRFNEFEKYAVIYIKQQKLTN